MDTALTSEASDALPASVASADTNLTDSSNNATHIHHSSKSWSTLENLHKPKELANAITAANDKEDVGDDDDDDDSYDLPTVANLVEDRWTPQPAWSIVAGPHDLKNALTPLLTSNQCYLGLVDFFQHAKVNATSSVYDEWLSAARVSVATESSSHLTGIRSLNIQPWVYAGGGLGNVDECLSLNTDRTTEEGPLVHVCLAGGTSRDSLTFASACVVAACSAEDVFADDFPERVATAGFRADSVKPTANNKKDKNDNSKFEVEYRELLSEYVTLHKRIARIGEYLGTGWVCGEYVVDWQPFPSLVWCGAMVLCTLFTFLGTYRRRRRSQTDGKSNCSNEKAFRSESNEVADRRQCCDLGTEKNNDYLRASSPISTSSNSSSSSLSSSSSKSTTREQDDKSARWFWSAWDARAHLQRLTHQRTETACLDGLKVGSILWVIGAHIMAIQSSTGAGYLNPKDFFPPSGITTTFFGQLLFSSRYAVDTFLCVSGYLAAYVLQRKLKNTNGKTSRCLGILKIVATIVFRVIRILPLYMCCLGFWMYLAPHMGSGPFWYQWEHFLEPCRQLWWTNLLFVNNIWPLVAPTESSCFYHSWYLAVDVQLFCLLAPWLVLVYQFSPTKARRVTVVLWLASVFGTALLAYINEWSVNSFDGFSVALFDIEGYAKPHVRAQSYLAGIFVAFWPRRQIPSTLRSKGRLAAPSFDNWAMVLALSGLATLSFVTVTGAYARRACTFGESPFEGDDCGSIWSPSVNFLHTAFGRATWSICIAFLLHMCLLGEEGNVTIGTEGDRKEKEDNDDESSGISVTRIVKKILGWSFWTPLAHLSFGAYLIHPIVIYVWFLGGREKVTFRLFTYIMEFCSITVVTFVASFAVTVLVEFPLGILLRPPSLGTRKRTPQAEGNITHDNHDAEMASLIFQSPTMPSSLPISKSEFYGSLQQGRQ
jgi:peptidoglycan/LPS O-acetylase OafA/YrhL